MSASSPVVSPRKGKHSRSKGFAFSSPLQEASSRPGGSLSALPANVDPLTLDPDDAFVRFSVREIQTIEASLQSTHDQLSSNLRSLVSEKYRDMLGTANTLIELSSSATNLVYRLDAVRQGVDKAKTQRDKFGDVSTVEVIPEERAESSVYAIAAATKLLAESPDEVYRAIDSASLDGSIPVPAKHSFQGRQLTDFKASTALRAAWIYILCQEAWKWLSEEKHEVDLDADTDIASLFPYISKQWLVMASMKTTILNVAHVGLQGWYPSRANGRKRWEDVSSSYIATITFLLISAFLQGPSIISCRDLLLSQRRRAIEERLRLGEQSPSMTLTRLVRGMAESMIHCLRAFVVVEDGSTLPHLASIFASTSSHSRQTEQVQFPPIALQALSTLPSASIYVECLPASVRYLTPQLDYGDAEDCMRTTAEVLREWSKSIREAGQKGSFIRLVDQLSTISSIGEAQIQLRESLDRCCNLVAKVCSQRDESLRTVVEQELRALVAGLEALLLQRLDVICQQRTAELPAAVSDSIHSALTLLSSSARATPRSTAQDVALEMDPTKFLFESEFTSSSLETRLRLQTPMVKRVLLAVEQHAHSLGEEMEAYAAYVQRDARKRAKRKHRRSKQEVQINEFHSSEDDVQMDRVLHSYRKAFDSARIALTDELNKRLESTFTEEGAEQDRKAQLLYMIRIASAFQHSKILSSNSVAGQGSNDLFLQRLEELRRKVVDVWVEEVVRTANTTYSTKVKGCADPRSDQLGRPTTAFVDSLMQIVNGVQAVGCGYQSEVSSLGRQLLTTFAASWQEMEAVLDEQELRCYTYDSHALASLLSDQHSSEHIQRLSKISSGLDNEQKEQIERALHRIRLILIPLRPLEAQTQGERRTSADKVVSAAPLPMLTIIQGRDRVPLIP